MEPASRVRRRWRAAPPGVWGRRSGRQPGARRPSSWRVMLRRVSLVDVRARREPELRATADGETAGRPGSRRARRDQTPRNQPAFPAAPDSRQPPGRRRGPPLPPWAWGPALAGRADPVGNSRTTGPRGHSGDGGGDVRSRDPRVVRAFSWWGPGLQGPAWRFQPPLDGVPRWEREDSSSPSLGTQPRWGEGPRAHRTGR